MEMPPKPFAVCEAPDFVRRSNRIWTIEEREAFIDHIARNALVGDVIQGTGGVRKVRWGVSGRGKRGGVRVIYYYYDETVPLHLLTMFAKNETADIGPDDKKEMLRFVRWVNSKSKSRFI
ncbi:MAG: addiction module toxin RelE [Micropepsaceae bacterium]